MTATEVQVLLASVVAFLVAIGCGVQWLLTHIKAIQLESEMSENKARTDLSERLQEEIRVLRLEMAVMRSEKNVYLRRIFQLEAYIHSHPSMSIPIMDGWPPI